jgi:hypothetical protein
MGKGEHQVHNRHARPTGRQPADGMFQGISAWAVDGDRRSRTKICANHGRVAMDDAGGDDHGLSPPNSNFFHSLSITSILGHMHRAVCKKNN